MDKVIKIGIGIMLLKDNKVLLGHRVNKSKDTGGIYEPDSWTFPGGKQEYDETIIEAAIRETKEETNLIIDNYKIISATDEFQLDRHFVTIGVLALSWSGEIKIMEPDKIDKWEWFDLNTLPENLYTPTKNFINEYLKLQKND